MDRGTEIEIQLIEKPPNQPGRDHLSPKKIPRTVWRYILRENCTGRGPSYLKQLEMQGQHQVLTAFPHCAALEGHFLPPAALQSCSCDQKPLPFHFHQPVKGGQDWSFLEIAPQQWFSARCAPPWTGPASAVPAFSSAVFIQVSPCLRPLIQVQNTTVWNCCCCSAVTQLQRHLHLRWGQVHPLLYHSSSVQRPHNPLHTWVSLDSEMAQKYLLFWVERSRSTKMESNMIKVTQWTYDGPWNRCKPVLFLQRKLSLPQPLPFPPPLYVTSCKHKIHGTFTQANK